MSEWVRVRYVEGGRYLEKRVPHIRPGGEGWSHKLRVRFKGDTARVRWPDGSESVEKVVEEERGLAQHAGYYEDSLVTCYMPVLALDRRGAVATVRLDEIEIHESSVKVHQ